jgi:hypothetical protein
MGERFFSKIQYGKEVKTTHGTAVAASKMLIGGKVSAVSADRKPRAIVEDIGLRAESTRMVHEQLLVTETLSIPEGYFQALPLLFGCGVKGDITPAPVTGGKTDYLWPFTPAVTFGTLNAPDSFSLQKGDDVQAFLTDYGMIERIKISGQVGQGAEDAPVSIEADFFSRQWTAGSFTGAIGIPAVTGMNAKLARLYLDTTWAGVGGTELTNALRSFEIDILTGVHPKFTGSANKYFNTHGEGLLAAMLTLTLEGAAAANAIRTAFAVDPQVLQVAQLTITGPIIPTATAHSLKFCLGGMWDEVIPLAEEDRGNNLTTCVLRGLYDPTGAKIFTLDVVTDISVY